MVINNLVYWKTTVAATYLMSAGDVVSQHQHEWQHTICLVAGVGEFEIYGGPEAGVVSMELNRNYLLPENIDHEIRSLADHTVMIALADKRDFTEKPVKGKAGGILMADGTVVYP